MQQAAQTSFKASYREEYGTQETQYWPQVDNKGISGTTLPLHLLFMYLKLAIVMNRFF